MNNQKSKSKKRKLSDLDESSGDDSNDTTENLASETEEGESENEDGSSSNASSSSIGSLPLTKRAARRAKGKKVVINLLVSDSSESEESESSSSSIKSNRKRKPGPRALSSSSSDSESQSSSDSNIKGCRRRRSGLLSDSSDSSDDSCEKCAICLHSIKRQEVGSPEVCDHLFCSVCIIEWSKNSNVCPLDRQQFSIILVRENKDATVVRKVSVEPEPQTNRVEDVELEGLDDTVCEICGSGDREDILLLCDTCDRGFHTVCLTPPLENIPDENEWFCPDCFYTASAEEIGFRDFVDLPSNPRSLRPRVSMVRTRLLERIRVAVNRIVDNLVPEDTDDSDSSYEEFDSELKTSESESVIVEDLPGPSGIRPARSNARKTTTKRRKKKVRKTKRSSTSTKRKRKTTTTTTKRKTTTGKRKTRRKTRRVKTTRTKKVKVENPDGTITEKIVRTRTYKRRRKHKTKKPKLKATGARRGLRVKSSTTPKTVKGRLALTLGMVPPKKPGQLLPDVKVRPPNSHITAIDLNRARAGIPKLHIFGPRDELQYYSSGSDHEDFIGGSSGGVATIVQQRTNISRLRDRKKAALALQSTPVTASKPKPVIETPAVGECMDILGSILDSQAIWHSKNTNVKIKEDGSIEVIKDNKPESGKKIDVREGKAEGATTQAPMYPGAGSRPGGFRPYNRTSYGETRSGQESAFAPRTGQSSTGVSFNRFGGPARNESYTNYLNNVPQGPTPFCRGGPPLRFRMPARQQLRRITFPARNRPAWQPEEEEENDEEKKDEGEEEKKEAEETQAKQQEDEDIDLYSDIETNVEKEENSGTEEGGTSYPALGPPPEPPAFLLGLDENGEFGVTETTDKSEVYDPAEPCDSEEEMVIDENKEQTPERKEPEEKASSPTPDASKSQPLPAEASPKPPQKASSEDDDEDCPIFSIYSSATREFSQKEEDERQREIEEDRKKLEEIKLQTEKSETATTTKDVPTEECEKVEKVETVEKSGEIEEIEKPLNKEEEKILSQEETTPNIRQSRSRSKSTEKAKEERSPSSESEKAQISGSEKSSSSPERKYTRSSKRDFDTDSDGDAKKIGSDKEDDDEDKENEERVEVGTGEKDEEEAEEDDKAEKTVESETEVSQKVATGLEGLEVEEVSSDNGDGAEFGDKRSLSSLSLSDLSHGSKRSPVQMKKKKKNKKRKSKSGKSYEEGEIDDSEKDNRLEESFDAGKNEEGNENAEAKTGGEKKRRKSDSGSERQILGSKENKKVTKEKTSKDKDLSWKKPSKKEKNYREGKKRSKERGRSRSPDRRKSRSPSPKKDKKKSKDRKKKTDKKKDIERYDVRKIVKNKEVRKTDAFGRDIVSKSRSISISRSRSPIRERSRNMLRRDSRSYSRSRSRSFRRGGGGGGRSPIRRRYLRSRTRSRSKSPRRSYSRSRSRSRSRKTKKKPKSKDRTKLRSRSRGRKSRSVSRGRRRSPTKSRSRTPIGRLVRGKKSGRSRRSWSHHLSRSPSFSPRRSRSVTRSPLRVRRSYSRSMSTSWSRGRSPLPRTSSLEKLTVVLTTKDKKKWKKKKEGRKSKKEEKRRKKGGGGNSKEVFASGDNVLVSVNFRNNNNSTGNNSGSLISTEGRNARLNSLSPPVPATKKKKGSDYEGERVAKKSKKSNPISKKAVDVALSNTCPKRAKKLTRLSEKDAEVILNRKPVAVIDLDMSPYREQTPSPVNVVVVSDSGSGDEGKEHTPARGAVAVEPEKMQETGGSQQVSVSAPSSPLENGYVPTSGPKTPPEPQIKFSINKPQQLRQIANPLGDDDDDEDEAEEEEGEQRMESLDRRIEKELNPASHKGPNTPPAPRGPSTPKTPPSPQTSPDAYDPFEPTKSRSPSPSQADKENRPSPKADGKEDQPPAGVTIEGVNTLAPAVEAAEKAPETNAETLEDKAEVEKSEAIPAVDCSSNAVIPSQTTGGVPAPEVIAESPIAVVITTPQSKTPTAASQKAYPPVMKQLPVVSSAEDAFSMPSPTKTSRSSATTTTTTTTTTQTLQQMTGIQRLQHRLGSPVNRTPNSVKSTPEKRATPRTDTNEIFSSGNYKIRNASKRNGEQPKQPRPLQDATNETIDITTDMDDSPYSPASSEGDDLFDPPVETAKPSQSNSKAAPPYKSGQKPPHKSPVKQLSKFDLLFGPSGPTLSPLKVGNKKTNAKPPAKTPTAPKVLLPKPQKKAAAKKNVMHKMDEDQLRILDELPSSAVELQVKDKFLKKLNRQERVVDEVKTVLKPHYARKHITKEEYKDILRRSVPKICHSRSGEINPSKIQSLIEAYVRKFRHAKKKGLNAVTATAAAKPKVKKTMFS